MTDKMSDKALQYVTLRNMSFNRLLELKAMSNNAMTDVTLKTEFKVRYDKIETFFKDFDTYHSKYIAQLTLDKASNEVISEADNARKDFDAMYFNIKAIYAEIFETKPQLVENTVRADPKCNIKLPKITLPKFAGDFKDWTHFKDIFETLVDKNTDLQPIEKFQYLISS